MLKHFFWMCSGADPDLLQSSSKSEQIKFAGIGGTVFFTAVMAFLASAYALFTVFENYYAAIGFGLLWGLLIFNLDRFIVSTIKKQGNFKKELVQVVPRIFLAVIIAVVIAKPLELKIFEKEINQVLLKQKNQLTLDNKDQIALQYTPQITRITGEIDQLKKEISTKEEEMNQLYSTYIAEAEGTAGTLKLGKGPVYKEKREKHDTTVQELKTLKETNLPKITEKETELAGLRAKQAEQAMNTQPVIDNFDGLMARINALNELPPMPSLFIFLLFLAIETAPIFSKLMSQKGEYDIKLAMEEDAIAVLEKQHRSQRDLLLKTDTDLNEQVYYDVTKDEETYAYKRQKATDILRLQTDHFFKKQTDILKS